jgi:hypothetical protein
MPVSAVVLLAATALGAAEPVRHLLLFDFERDCGQFNPGGEFPGAQGRFAVVREAAHDGAAGGRLTFDLSRGAYVAWVAEVPVPLAAGARELTVWVRPDAPGRIVHCKTRDSTGQEHIRFTGPLALDDWQMLSFDLTRHVGHWGGANDGAIHWPITAVQIGVEAKGQPRGGSLDLDTITVSTSATPAAQPGFVARLESGRYGNLFVAGEAIDLRLVVTSLEARPAAVLSGSYAVYDWQDREVVGGPSGLISLAAAGERQAPLAVRVPGSGAFRVTAELRSPQDPSEKAAATTWFGVLPGPNPPPCGWVGTGLHSGHGWGRGDLRFLDILSAAGIGVVREEFGWSGIETTRGQYAVTSQTERFVDGLKERGIRLNLLLSYGNPIYDNPLDPEAYARWTGWMARHFRGRVHDFEVWNEPANFMFQKQYGGERFGNAPWIGKFVELSLKAGRAIREAQPEATVVLCAEDCWPTLKQMLEEGIGPAGHAVSVHPYCHGQPRPEREWFLADGGSELRAVSRARGGPERVVITEAGWTTYEGEMEYLQIAGGYPRSSLVHQAQYIVRMYLSAKASGTDYALQYDFMDDGPQRNYTEHNFGLVHADASPKPSLMAVAALTRLVGQGRYAGDASPDPARLRAYVFRVRERPVIAAYALEGAAELTLPVGVARVEVADLMGNRQPWECPGGVLRLALTETPVYVLGGDPDVTGRFCQVTVAQDVIDVVAGETVRVPMRFVIRSGERLRPRVRCLAPAGVEAELDWGSGWRAPLVADGCDRRGEVVIRVGAQVTTAAEVVVTTRLPGRRLERAISVRPQAPVSARFGTLNPTADGLEGSLHLRNLGKGPVQTTATVSATPGGNVVLPEGPWRLAGGEDCMLPFRVAALPAGPLVAEAQVQTADGWHIGISDVLLVGVVGRIEAAPAVDAELGDWTGATNLPLSHASQYAAVAGQRPWQGAGDLAASVRLGWCAEGLCLGVEVDDDVFCQPYTDEPMWQGDSVQFAAAPGVEGTSRFEVGLARTAQGDRCFVYSALAPGEPRALPPVRFVSRLAGKGGGIVYEALVPWQLLPGISPVAGTQFRFSLLVNDNDGKGRRGWLHAFDGIGWSKDPAQYGVMTLGE